jgi:hypothetical protein
VRFQPVHLPEGLGGRASQTFLRHYDRCPRSAYLYALHKDDAKTVEMVRGTAIHEACARGTLAAIEQGEPGIPPEVAKAITDEVLAEQHVPIEQHDYIRESVYRWASEATFDPGSVVAVETLFVLDIGGYQVRAKVDFAQLLEDGAAVLVRDFKSSRAAPAYDEIARKRPDGTLAAKSFQLVLYAVLLAFGVPVRVEKCDNCFGTGVMWGNDTEHATMAEAWEAGAWCPLCGGATRDEIPEPFSVASQAQRFDLEFVYPGIEDREGRMPTRPMSLTRLELIEYRASLEALLTRVAASEASGDWPAIVSDAGCGECPAAQLCPIPVELRDHRGTINSVDEAAEACEVLDREKAEHRARQTELRNFAKANGGEIRYGRKVFELVYSEHEEIRDKEGLLAAVDRAVRYGDPFERSEFVKVKGRTDFKARDMSEEELEEGNGGNNGTREAA